MIAGGDWGNQTWTRHGYICIDFTIMHTNKPRGNNSQGHVRHLTFRHVDSLFRFSIKFVDSEFGSQEPQPGGSYT